jgi:hypothetical protein
MPGRIEGVGHVMIQRACEFEGGGVPPHLVCYVRG